MKLIPLTKGLSAMVDDEDYDYLNQWKWYASKNNKTFYAEKWSEGITIIMHRLIMKTPSHLVVDHIDGNGLNNQKANLRNCTHAQNIRNTAKVRGDFTSQYKGVYWHKRDKCWRATIRCNPVIVHIGSFQDEEAAALAYNEAAIKYHGEFARINIINQ